MDRGGRKWNERGAILNLNLTTQLKYNNSTFWIITWTVRFLLFFIVANRRLEILTIVFKCIPSSEAWFAQIRKRFAPHLRENQAIEYVKFNRFQVNDRWFSIQKSQYQLLKYLGRRKMFRVLGVFQKLTLIPVKRVWYQF